MRPRSPATWILSLAFPVVALAQEPRVVVYVSHDQEHSQAILLAFEKSAGLKVDAQYDTEDNKTVGLTNRIIAEKDAPKADVFWNNECGQSERLRRLGLLAPYVSPQAADIPASLKNSDGYWTGFAARARILIWNTNLISEDALPKRFEELADAKFKGKLAMALPLTGTTLTHAGALYATWGESKTDQFWTALKANDVRWERGNAQVAARVSEGVRPFGLTDTDDFNVKRLEGAPVKRHFLDQGEDGFGTLVIPNSVMILKGAKNQDAARRLVDYLLSPEVEKLLAEGRAAQMPLHPGVATPEHVASVDSIRSMVVDFGRVGEMLEKKKTTLANVFDVAPTRSGGVSPLWFALGALILAMVFVFMAVRPRSRA